jgi:hypothetical protein
MNVTVKRLTDSELNLTRFVPIPNHASKINFNQILNGVGNVATTALNNAASLMTGGASSIDPTYQIFLEKQMYFQEQMLQVSLVSNTEKTSHDTKMAAVRNIRAS